MPSPYRKIINEAIAACGESVNQPGWTLDDQGACRLTLADGRDLAFVLDEKRGCLWLVVGMLKLPEDHQLRAVLYERMLMANLLCAESKGGSLAVDSASDVAVLQFCWKAANVTKETLLLGVSMVVSRANATAEILMGAARP